MVLDGGPLVAVGAVVVAGEDVGVDVAQADEVVGLGVAVVDAGLVASAAGVNDVLGGTLVLGSDKASGGCESHESSGETHLGRWVWRRMKTARGSCLSVDRGGGKRVQRIQLDIILSIRQTQSE